MDVVVFIIVVLLAVFFWPRKRPRKSNRLVFTEETSYPSQRSFDEWRADLSTIWSGPQRTIAFTYRAADEEVTRRHINAQKVMKDRRGRVYLEGFCLMRNEPRTFNFDRIKSSIEDEGKKYLPYDWLTDVLNIKSF